MKSVISSPDNSFRYLDVFCILIDYFSRLSSGVPWRPQLMPAAVLGSETEGTNEVSHVIDLSFLYSSVHYLGTPPPAAGDINQNPLVFALSRVLMDEHNRLVSKMTAFNRPSPSFEARKLLIGIFQHITYNEYLPMLLGASTPVKSLTTGTLTHSSTTLPMVYHSFVLAYKLAMASMLRETVTIDPTPNINLKGILNDQTQIDTATELANITKGMLTDCSLKIGKEIPCNFRNDCAYSDVVSIIL
ncbi:peroxidase mlt-7-like [Octopus vulgaris]|uniref:Peroxidase mlt-7-like n=1 Tax=Octopus vulgaris TaxID=6645 RepID=A0AA36BNR9_OCTVU|nr:peroxidase mlt-7-like [Octopus vulgaris]